MSASDRASTQPRADSATGGLEWGLRAPDFALPLDGAPTRFYARAGGRPTVLFLCDAERLGELRSLAQEVASASRVSPELFAVIQTENALADTGLTFPVFADSTGAVIRGYGYDSEDGLVACVMDANLRIHGSVVAAQGQESDAAREIAATLDGDGPDVDGSEIDRPAPVLIVPRVLDPEMCALLMATWQEDNQETGVEQTLDGRRGDVISHDAKRRRDHVVTDPELMQSLTTEIGRRVIPEIHKAFAFKATRFEGFKIVRYSADEGGHFHAHRDNLSTTTAHRRFGITINLNDGFEGAHIRFPEYGPHLYRPAAGAALVFSCSNLHEVTPVTQGSRFAVLSFMFGPAEARS